LLKEKGAAFFETRCTMLT